MSEAAHDVLWRRLKYQLTPQWDIYVSLREKVMGATVLEVGFGTGAGVLQYASAAQQVDAIEVDPGAVLFAREMWVLPNVRWRQGDITHWNGGGAYDFAVMIETLEHVEDWQRALWNIKQLLKPGGYLIMSARNANADLRRWKDLHEREWTAEELVGALSLFPSVYLYDYNLAEQQNEDTRLTPLIAIAKK